MKRIGDINIIERHSEKYSSRVNAKNTGNIRFFVSYELKKEYYKSLETEYKHENLNLSIRNGIKKTESIFQVWWDHLLDKKLIIQTRDSLCSGLLEPVVMHYDLVQHLKNECLPLSLQARAFLDEGIRNYFAELKKHGITNQIKEYKKWSRKYQTQTGEERTE